MKSNYVKYLDRVSICGLLYMGYQSSVSHNLVKTHVKVEISNSFASYCMAGYCG